jgi:SAM-dependent methyltransferase
MFETEPATVRWEPNVFLMGVTQSMMPGNAIDVGMGSGRNAIFLARLGWMVTGIDTSRVGVARARERAGAEKLSLNAGQQDMFQFDYGVERYDLVLFMYMGPVRDLDRRLVEALRPGGYLVIEHFAGAFEPGSLPMLFRGLDVLQYTEVDDFPDYDQRNKQKVVRFLGRKRR